MLNGSTLEHKKKTPEGINIRKQLLKKVINNSIDAFTIVRNQLHKKDAQDDDIVDSMILSYNALKIYEGFFIQFPEADTFNNQEIRMNVRIWNGV